MCYPGGYKEMSSILADQEPKCGGRRGVAGSHPMRTAVHITWHGDQINFGDLTPYLTFWCYQRISIVLRVDSTGERVWKFVRAVPQVVIVPSYWYEAMNCKDTIPKIRTNVPRKVTARLQSRFLHSSCSCERFIYSSDRSAYFAAGKHAGGPKVRIYRPITDTWMWKLGLRARGITFLGIYKFKFICIVWLIT